MEPGELLKIPIQGPMEHRNLPSREERIDPDDERRKQVARDFESVLIYQLMKTMRATIPESGLFDDSTRAQFQDMFWQFLSQDVSGNGGIGLWKNIYAQMSKSPANEAVSLMDNSA